MKSGREERYQTVKELLSDLRVVRQETSSPQYVLTGIGRHKLIALVVLAAFAASVVGYLAYRGRAGGAEIRSVAVHPFENAGGNPDAEYLSEGVAESLINSLSRLPNLRVMARRCLSRPNRTPR